MLTYPIHPNWIKFLYIVACFLYYSQSGHLIKPQLSLVSLCWHILIDHSSTASVMYGDKVAC